MLLAGFEPTEKNKFLHLGLDFCTRILEVSWSSYILLWYLVSPLSFCRPSGYHARTPAGKSVIYPLPLIQEIPLEKKDLFSKITQNPGEIFGRVLQRQCEYNWFHNCLQNLVFEQCLSLIKRNKMSTCSWYNNKPHSILWGIYQNHILVYI